MVNLVDQCNIAGVPLVVMVLQPVVEVAFRHAFVNKQFGILAGDYAHYLDYVLVIDVPRCLHLRVGLPVV